VGGLADHHARRTRVRARPKPRYVRDEYEYVRDDLKHLLCMLFPMIYISIVPPSFPVDISAGALGNDAVYN